MALTVACAHCSGLGAACVSFGTGRSAHAFVLSPLVPVVGVLCSSCSAYQPAPPQSPRPPAPRHTHAQPRPNTTRACSMLHPASHAGRGNTLEESCCRTCRRLRAKYRRRPQTVTFTYPTPFDRGRPASDPGAAARAEAEPMGRSAASQLATVTRRSLQPPSCPPSERRRAATIATSFPLHKSVGSCVCVC